jgi:hypothetical protein
LISEFTLNSCKINFAAVFFFFNRVFSIKDLNPDAALDFVTTLNYSIKARAHGLFLKKERKFSEYKNE